MVIRILNNDQRVKEDQTDDSLFYSSPRFVHHLDESFRKKLQSLYRERISEDSIILDLMSSWTSHLPLDRNYQKVIGHGLNKAELESNNRLDSHWVQDLNKNQKLPINDSSIDTCMMVAAWQYLQEPEEIASELKRIIKPKGQLIISFSNRAFWSKAPKIWTEGTDFDHINYIIAVLKAQGWDRIEHISDKSSNKKLFNIFDLPNDPFFAVIAIR